jgi:hypothetical protein
MIWFIVEVKDLYSSSIYSKEHNIWYQSSFFGQRKEDFFFLFADFFKGKKGVTHFRLNSETF